MRVIWATHCQTGKGDILFLSDSTTRPSDLLPVRPLKEASFSLHTNEDKLTTKQLGPPRPNVSIQQVFFKGGGILNPRIGTKENRG